MPAGFQFVLDVLIGFNFAPLICAAEATPPYTAALETGVVFQSKNASLQRLHDAAVEKLLANIIRFTPSMDILVEGGGYMNAWIETQPQGLTYQRAIDAFERYGHFAEVSLLGNKLLPVLIRNECQFSQQLDAMTGDPSGPKPDGYGPMMLAALEYFSRLHGIHMDVSNNRVWWSSVDPKAEDFNYRQRWGTQNFELRHSNGKFEALVGGKPVFKCDSGVRVITDLDGRLLDLVGISPDKQDVKLIVSGITQSATVSPNEIHELTSTGIQIKSRVPFSPPNPISKP